MRRRAGRCRIPRTIVLMVLATAAFACRAPDSSARSAAPGSTAEAEVLRLLQQDAPYHLVPADLFERLGWDLPDGGQTVHALANAAPGGAFDPRALETLSVGTLGYSARWHEVRFQKYGLDWDVPALHLVPETPVPDLPTVVFINGGSANWYEFFVGPTNAPAVAQHLAQRVPVLLLTIPGNYRHGGWDEPDFAKRIPAYVLDRDVTPEEARVRNAVFTFALVRDGVRAAIEEVVEGPVAIVGHSTGAEVQFLLRDALAGRLRGRSLGWGTGGPASLSAMREIRGEVSIDDYAHVGELRPRGPEEYARRYVGPLNPLWRDDATPLEVATQWIRLEARRRPQFKQPLQDMEHQGADALRPQVEAQIREVLRDTTLGIDADEVVADLFTTTAAPVVGYRRMIWTTALGDTNHWHADPALAREVRISAEFRQANPGVPIRVLVFDVPLSHYGHLERPRELAGGLLAALRWVSADDQGRAAPAG